MTEREEEFARLEEEIKAGLAQFTKIRRRIRDMGRELDALAESLKQAQHRRRLHAIADEVIADRRGLAAARSDIIDIRRLISEFFEKEMT